MTSSRNLVLTIGAQASSKTGLACAYSLHLYFGMNYIKNYFLRRFLFGSRKLHTRTLNSLYKFSISKKNKHPHIKEITITPPLPITAAEWRGSCALVFDRTCDDSFLLSTSNSFCLFLMSLSISSLDLGITELIGACNGDAVTVIVSVCVIVVVCVSVVVCVIALVLV